MSQFPKGLTLDADEKFQAGYGVGAKNLYPAPAQPNVKRLRFPVVLPDGTEGVCSFEALGHTMYRFSYSLGDRLLASQYYYKAIEDTVEAVDAVGQELAESAFLAAVDGERQGFKAVKETPTRKKSGLPAMFTAKKAKELGGKYFLCQPVGRNLVPVSHPIEDMLAAVEMWRKQPHLIIGCCDRLNRRFEQPTLIPCKEHPKKTEVAQ